MKDKLILAVQPPEKSIISILPITHILRIQFLLILNRFWLQQKVEILITTEKKKDRFQAP